MRDILIGGNGADTINSGAANDNVQDIFRFTATAEFGDTVTNFDANGADAVDDRVEFSGALNTAWDDGNNNDAFLFASGNGGGGTVNATVGQGNGDFEALLLTGAGGEGVTTANLGNAALVSAAFNNEFVLTAGNGEDALLVINDTNANSFSLWQWVQAGGGEMSAAELTLIGIFDANATVTAGNFDFALRGGRGWAAAVTPLPIPCSTLGHAQLGNVGVARFEQEGLQRRCAV